MWYNILGGIFLAIAVIVYFCMLSTKKRYEQLIGSGKQKIGEIVETYKQTRQELGGDDDSSIANEALTVKGQPSCDDPLISPMGKKPCIYYSMKVTVSRIEHYTENDSEGKPQQKTRTVTDTVEESSNSTRFKITDETGTVLVDPKNGSFEGTTKTVDESKTVRPEENTSTSISFGGFTLNLAGRNINTAEPQTYKYYEEIMGLDRNLTVIGTLRDSMGEFVIEKYGKNDLIVSTKSQEEMIAETKSTMKSEKIASIVCGAIGIVLLILGIIL